MTAFPSKMFLRFDNSDGEGGFYYAEPTVEQVVDRTVDGLTRSAVGVYQLIDILDVDLTLVTTSRNETTKRRPPRRAIRVRD